MVFQPFDVFAVHKDYHQCYKSAEQKVKVETRTFLDYTEDQDSEGIQKCRYARAEGNIL